MLSVREAEPLSAGGLNLFDVNLLSPAVVIAARSGIHRCGPLPPPSSPAWRMVWGRRKGVRESLEDQSRGGARQMAGYATFIKL